MEILLAIFILFIRLLYKFVWNSPDRIGRRGEKEVERILSKLPDSHYKVLNDVLIKIGGTSVQIDHIVISTYGIFVIETKNYSGWIIGKEMSREWTQCIYDFRHTFYNPIKQNHGHVSVLRSILGLSTDFFVPIVVFTDRAKLKITSQSTVIYANELLETIKRYNTQILFDLETLLNKINSRIISDENARLLHKMSVQNKVQRQENLRNNRLDEGKCPDCGNDLMVYHGKYGVFIGCCGYPYCQYSRNL